MTQLEDRAWNRCDVCGRFISLEDFGKGAVRDCVYPDSELTRETWKTLCIRHATDEAGK
jgi:hypothetical protein